VKEIRQRIPIKHLSDGRALINLGSSARCAPEWNNIDFSWIVRLGRHPRLCRALHSCGWLTQQRYERIQRLDPGTILWDLRKGIPFSDQSFDAVYHCHLLEHLDKEAAPWFLRECHRVLKPVGILRVVVPDLEFLARKYLDCVERLPDKATSIEHACAVEAMIDQMVVRTPSNRKYQKPIVRFIENLIVGDTSQNGVLHRWMYDRFSLEHLMREAGFNDIQLCDATTSRISGWPDFLLDTEPDGSPYKPGSVYIEGECS
jgi:SAM-dependent methyltransferase